MPINLELIEDGRILWFRIDRSWTPEEILASKETTQRIFKEATKTVYSLADLRGTAVSVPLLWASHSVIGGELLPNAGPIAVVGVSWLMRGLAQPILQLADGGDSVSFFDGFEDARSHLRRLIARETPQ